MLFSEYVFRFRQTSFLGISSDMKRLISNMLFVIILRLCFPFTDVLSVCTDVEFNVCRVVFSSHLKSKVGNIPGVAKATGLRMTLNIDVAPIASKSHTHPSHSQTSRRSGTDQGQIAQAELLKL